MKPRQTVFVGSQPPGDRAFDWVTEPSARVSLGDAVSIADISIVKGLLDDAVPVIEALTDGPRESLLRDEFFQLVLSVARVEATMRSLDPAATHDVVAARTVPRPSRPGRIGEGVAQFLGADLVWVGGQRPQRFPAGLVGSARAWRWSRGRSGSASTPIAVAVGGPSELRALAPVCRYLDTGSFTMLDFALEPDRKMTSFGSWLTTQDATRRIDHRQFVDRSAEIWGSHDWWGKRWLPWVRPSLVAMSRITLREAELFFLAAERALADAELLVTAKVRFARARAIVAAAAELGLATVGTQHGMYVDGNEWTDIRTDSFAASGSSFARILERRGYAGRVELAGAPFYRAPKRKWDCGIALQPPEGVVITSRSDYERHAVWAFRSAQQVLGEGAKIGFRLHPREDERRLRSLLGGDALVSRDPDQGAELWISVESSFIVEAVLSEAPTVLINFNSHPWEYKFFEMPGIWVASDETALRASLEQMVGAVGSTPVAAWREEFAVAIDDEAARTIARMLTDRIGS